MAVKVYDATVKRIEGDLMTIKVHGGSTIVIPSIPEASRATPITVFMEPGQKTVKEAMLKRRFNEMTRDNTHHDEHTERDHSFDVLEADGGYDHDDILPL